MTDQGQGVAPKAGVYPVSFFRSAPPSPLDFFSSRLCVQRVGVIRLDAAPTRLLSPYLPTEPTFTRDQPTTLAASKRLTKPFSVSSIMLPTRKTQHTDVLSPRRIFRAKTQKTLKFVSNELQGQALASIDSVHPELPRHNDRRPLSSSCIV